MMQLILLGPPGAGKGTQAIALAKQWKIPHVSTGDLLRRAIEEKTEVGVAAAKSLEAGELVPDEVVMRLVRDRFAQSDMNKGWILDGFPRTLDQVKALDSLLSELDQPLPKVVYFKVMTGLLIDRLLAMGRADDTVATIRRRLAVYEAETVPLIEHYEKQLCLTVVNASLPAAEVASALSRLGQKETGAARYIADETEFEALLSEAKLLVVDCTATWCGPCKLVAPLMDRLAEEYGERVNVFKLDIEANKSVAKRFGVKGIPAVMFFKGGALVEQTAGVHPYEMFGEAVERNL